MKPLLLAALLLCSCAAPDPRRELRTARTFSQALKAVDDLLNESEFEREWNTPPTPREAARNLIWLRHSQFFDKELTDELNQPEKPYSYCKTHRELP